MGKKSWPKIGQNPLKCKKSLENQGFFSYLSKGMRALQCSFTSCYNLLQPHKINIFRILYLLYLVIGFHRMWPKIGLEHFIYRNLSISNIAPQCQVKLFRVRLLTIVCKPFTFCNFHIYECCFKWWVFCTTSVNAKLTFIKLAFFETQMASYGISF